MTTTGSRVFTFILFLLPSTSLAITGTASVIDSDTIEIHGEGIRFHGIDAPESEQTCTLAGEPWRCGQQAALVHDSTRWRPRSGISRSRRTKSAGRFGRSGFSILFKVTGHRGLPHPFGTEPVPEINFDQRDDW